MIHRALAVALALVAASFVSPPESRGAGRVAVDAAVARDARWSDLLRPVDSTTGEPVADATVVLVRQDGTREVVPIDDPVRDEDLARASVAALEAPGHCARWFRPHALDAGAREPLRVALAPAASLEVRFVADGLANGVADEVPSARVAISAALPFGLVDPEREDVGERSREKLAGPLAMAAMNIGWVLGPNAEPRDRRRQLLWIGRQEHLGPLFDLVGPPLRAAAAARAPIEITADGVRLDGLPTDVELSVVVASSEWVRLANDADRSVRLAVGDTRAIEVVHAPPPSVVAQLPADATRVEVEVRGPGRRRFVPVAARTARDGERSTLAFHLYGPGTHTVRTTWDDADGRRRASLVNLEAQAAEEVDLGRLEPLEPIEVRLDVDFTLESEQLTAAAPDAVDWSGVPDAIADAKWRLVLEPADTSARERRAQAFEFSGFRPAAIELPHPGAYDARIEHDDGVRTPDGARWSLWMEAIVFDDLESGSNIAILAGAWSLHPTRVRLDFGGIDLRGGDFRDGDLHEIRLFAFTEATDEVLTEDLVLVTRRDASSGAAFVECEAYLGTGTWEVGATTRYHGPDGRDPRTFLGFGEVEVASGGESSVEVDLAPGASIRVKKAFVEKSSWGGGDVPSTHPIGKESAFAWLWRARFDSDGDALYEGLLPDTAYRGLGIGFMTRTAEVGSEVQVPATR